MTDIRIPFARSPQRVRLMDASELAESVAAEAQAAETANLRLLQQLFGGLHAAVQDLQTQQRQSLAELQQVAVELSSAAASWLTMASIDRNQFNVEELIARSIEQLGGGSSITVRLSPLDHELFTQLQEASETDLPLPPDVNLVSDVSLPRGSCTAESQKISLVTDLETRLASVRQAWLENLDDAQTERRATGRNGWEPGRVPDRRETA